MPTLSISGNPASMNGMYGATLALNALTGLGIGIDTILFGHFSFPLEFGYVAEYPVNPGIQFSVSGGIRYRF